MQLQTITTITAALLAASVWAQAPEPPQASVSEQNEERQPDPGRSRRATEASPADDRPIQSQVVVPAGAWIKIRVDQPLSSDRNQVGDSFSGTLTQPIVADGLIVAHRGQTVEGRITEAIKAGKAKGTSRLGLELTEIGLVDGQQMSVRTHLAEFNGGTSIGRDAAAVGATTGVGAAIGGAAAGGMGAGIGALAGAVASGIGVMATRGRATEIYPEMVVTFRTVAPMTISTDRAPHAFEPVRQTDYERQSLERRPAPQRRPSMYYGGYGYDPYFFGGPSLWYGGGYGYWGPRYYGGGARAYIGGRGGHRRR